MKRLTECSRLEVDMNEPMVLFCYNLIVIVLILNDQETPIASKNN